MNCSNDNQEINIENIVPPIINEKAASKIQEKFDKYENQKGTRPFGIRINVNRDGCAGLSYGMEYVMEEEENYIETNGIKAFLDENAMKMLSEAVIEYHETESASGFVFNNPNEQCKCACGKSFSA